MQCSICRFAVFVFGGNAHAWQYLLNMLFMLANFWHLQENTINFIANGQIMPHVCVHKYPCSLRSYKLQLKWLPDHCWFDGIGYKQTNILYSHECTNNSPLWGILMEKFACDWAICMQLLLLLVQCGDKYPFSPWKVITFCVY